MLAGLHKMPPTVSNCTKNPTSTKVSGLISPIINILSTGRTLPRRTISSSACPLTSEMAQVLKPLFKIISRTSKANHHQPKVQKAYQGLYQP